jgi:cation-transporting ATPase E
MNDQEPPENDLAALEEGQPPLPRTSTPGTGGASSPAPESPPAETRPAPIEASAEPRPVRPLDVPPPVASSPPDGGTATGAPSSAQPPLPAPEARPTDLMGLTASEAEERTREGRTNADTSHQRTDGEVIRENTLTFFNGVLAALIVALFVLAGVEQDLGKLQDGVFVGIVVFANVTIGTFQELRATRKLRELVALTAPTAVVVRDGETQECAAEAVVQDDLVRAERGDQIVADGTIVEGELEVDEALLTGESDPVRRLVGQELRSGSFCVSGSCHYRAEKVGLDAYATRLTADARQLVRRATPLQMRFRSILRVLLLATAILAALLLIRAYVANDDLGDAITATAATVTSVVPEGLLLSLTVAFAAGAVRISRAGAIVQDISVVEALNYIDVICLDKTGTITANTLVLNDVHWAPGAEGDRPWVGAFAAATRQESPTAEAIAEGLASSSNGAQVRERVPFNSQRRWSAAQLDAKGGSRNFLLGAPDTLLPHCANADDLAPAQDEAVAGGYRAVVFVEASALPDPDAPLPPLRAVALITIADVLRADIADAFQQMDDLEIEPKIISGDHPETVAALIRQLNVDLRGGAIAGPALTAMDDEGFDRAVADHSIFGRIDPVQKARIVSTLRRQGHFVAMVGDGANDVRALRDADVAVAMESGSRSARGVSGIILRDDSFHALVRGTGIAAAVFGNSAQLAKLYITKSFYAYLSIVAAEFLGLDFPFLPRHGGLTALITLGVPAAFIALTQPPRYSGESFTTNILRFAIPASLALAAATVSVHLLTQGFLDRPIEVSRTLVTLTIGIVGLFYMVQVVGFEGARLRRPIRPISVTLFGLFLLAALISVVYITPLRDFFDFEPLDIDEWAIVIPAIAFSIAGQFVIKRYWREIVGWIVKSPSEEELSRGRSP